MNNIGVNYVATKLAETKTEENGYEVEMVHLAEIALKVHMPRQQAEALCAQIRTETAGQWHKRQTWACQRCMLLSRDGVPTGLLTAGDDLYACKAIARRFVHKVAS